MALLPPTALIAGREPRFGQFADSLRDLGLGDYRLRTPFGRPASRLAHWLKFKRFQYFSAMSDSIVFGCALAHLRHTGMVFVHVHHLREGPLFSRSWRPPLGAGMTLSDNPVEGESRFTGRGVAVRMGYRSSPRVKTLSVTVGDGLRLEAAMPEEGFEPMSLCTRAGYTGWAYANKVAGLALEGELRLGDRRFDLSAIGAMGHHDFSCGFMRRETWWNWACFSGRSEGVRLGLNLSCGVNETSFTENCLWVDGRLQKVNLARFAFDARDLDGPWTVTSDDGRVDLRFTPAGRHAERLDLGLVASSFNQLVGTFDGVLRVGGREHPVARLPGLVEDQYARW